jgi:hypothetical protein
MNYKLEYTVTLFNENDTPLIEQNFDTKVEAELVKGLLDDMIGYESTYDIEISEVNVPIITSAMKAIEMITELNRILNKKARG